MVAHLRTLIAAAKPGDKHGPYTLKVREWRVTDDGWLMTDRLRADDW